MRSSSSQFRSCFDVIENYDILEPSTTSSFPETTSVELCDQLFQVQNILEKEDVQFLFDLLHQDLRRGKLRNFEEVVDFLDLLLTSANREESTSKLKQILDDEILFFLKKAVHFNEKNQLEYHILLHLFSLLDKITLENADEIEIFQILHFLKIFKISKEMFPCGCVQQQMVKAYKAENCNKLCILINRLMTSESDNLKISKISLFEFYVELVRELVSCRVIDENSEELHTRRLPHIIKLLTDLQNTEFCNGCTFFSALFKQLGAKRHKVSDALKLSYKRYLLPCVFGFLATNNGSGPTIARMFTQDFDELAQRICDGFPLTDHQNFLVFRPLEVLKSILKVDGIDVADIFETILVETLTKIKISPTPHFRLFLIYFLSLVNLLPDPCPSINKLLEMLMTYFKTASNHEKDFVFLVLEILEQIGKVNEKIGGVFEKEKPRNKILLQMDSSKPADICYFLKFVEILSEPELNRCLEQITHTPEMLEECQWIEMFEKLAEIEFCCKNDKIWEISMSRFGGNERSVRFLMTSLVKIAGKGEKLSLKGRIVQIMGFLKREEVGSQQKIVLPPMNLLLEFVNTTLGIISDFEAIISPNITNELIPLVFMAYAYYFDENEQRIKEVYAKLLDRIENRKEEDVLQNLKRICQISKQNFKVASSNCDLKVWGRLRAPNSNNGESYVKSFKMYLEMGKGEERVKARILRIFTTIFEFLSSELREMGDKGTAPFCLIANGVENQLAEISKRNPDFFEELAEKMMNGYVRFEKGWNVLFTIARVINILVLANDVGKFSKFADLCEDNNMLTEELMKNSKFQKFRPLVNWF